MINNISSDINKSESESYDNFNDENIKSSLNFDANKLHMVKGHYYDLSSFNHPGGNLIIEQSKGEDVTASVMSHHFTDTVFKVLNH